ncbi:translocation/assembly module TamB domain-containing protein [Tardiphaga sp.]|jgi:translocation and assembly module TamB|uniref:translocation/assembly module TamB domain-containing protein n=1 Tax=Tardiphaga sp. TaxID=1926292 RepID=UPI0037D9A86F
MRLRRRTIFIGLGAFVLLLGMAGYAVLHFTLRVQGDDKGLLANLISRALSTPAAQISIGDVSGVLTSDVTVSDVSIADQDGVWLKLDKVRLVWRRTALLAGRLEIDRLDVGHLAIHRKPLPAPAASAAAPSSPSSAEAAPPDEALLPDIPVKVEVKSFALTELSLGEPLLGVGAQLTATGQAVLGNPAEGLSLRLDARRLDAQGVFATRLDYVPASGKLETAMTIDEAPGGIVVRLLKVADLPSAKLDLRGTGTLDAFDAKLAFDAGPSTGANGAAQLTKQVDGRRLTLDLGARIEGLLPSVIQPIFAGTTRLNSSIGFAPDGGVRIEPLSVVSKLARMDIGGSVDAQQVADLTIRMRALPNTGDTTEVNDFGIKTLAFDATVKGALSGPQVAAAAALRDARLPQGRFGQIDASFNASPAGSLLEKDTAIRLAGQVKATGLHASDAAIDSAVGSSLSLMLAGTSRAGIVDVQTLQLQTETAEASFIGQVGGPLLKGRADIISSDLARFGALAGLKLRGALTFGAQLDGRPDTGRIDARLDGKLSGLSTGIGQLDGLTGGAVELAGAIRMLPNAGFGFDDLRIAGRHISARVHGDATKDNAAISAAVVIPQLSHADKTLSGQAEANAQLTGSLDKLNAHVAMALNDVRASGRPVPRVTLELAATDVTGALDARATLAGTIDRNAANGRLHVAKQADGGWRLDDLDLRIGSVAARGGVALDAERRLSGQLTASAGNLDDLSPLLLAKLAGAFDANLNFTAEAGGQNAQVALRGQGLKYAGDAIGKIDVQAALRDVWRRPLAQGDIAIDNANVAGEVIPSIRLAARSTPSGSDITLKLNGKRIGADLKATLVPAGDIRLDLAALTARYENSRIALARPASFTLRGSSVDIRDFALALDRGVLSLNGSVGETLDLTLSAKAVPLAIANAVAPQLGLAGTLDAQARVTGTAEAPSGDWRVAIAGLAAAQTREFALAPMGIQASGRLSEGQTTLDAQVSAPRLGQLRAGGKVPLQRGALDLAVKGSLDLAAANGHLSPQGRRLSGRSDIDLRVTGALDKPKLNGAATLSGGTFDDVELGTKLTGIAARIAARNDDVVVERFTATSANGGSLNASGNVRIDPDAGLPGAIQISGRDVLLASNAIMKMRASPNLRIAGPLMRDPRITGRIDVDGLDVNVPERLPSTLKPLAGTRHVDAPEHVRLAIEKEEKARKRTKRAPPFDAGLDLTISAPNRVFVRGRGIDAELGGDMRLTGRLASPVTIGAFEMRRGKLQVAGTRLDFSRGRATFSGEVTPELDFVAQTQAGDVTAQITVSGIASAPTFAFSSSPDLPQDEVLSRIMFSKASGGLSPFQAVQLAQMVAQFSGDGGPDTMERLRRSLGVDALDISAGGAGGPSVGAARAINSRVSVGVKGAAAAKDSAVTLDIDLTRRLRLQGEASGAGATSIGIGTEIEY